MRRSIIPSAILVIAVAVMVVVSPAAATGHLAAASTHTTDSDFNSADTLENVSVGDGSVEFVAVSNETTDDFEDGDLAEYSGATDNFSVSGTTPVLEGSQTLHHDTNGFAEIISTSGLGAYPSQGDTYRWDFNAGAGAEALVGVQDTDNYYILEANPSGSFIRIQEKNSGSITTLQSTSTSVPSDTHLRGKLDWTTSGDLKLTVINVSSDNTVGSVNATDTSFTSGGIGWRGDTDTHYDNATTETQIADVGTYISETHSAENVTEGWTNLTLENSSADVTWQANTSGTWSDVASTTYSSSGNRTLDVSSVSADEWRVNVTFHNGTGETTAELHDEGVLFDPAAPDAELTSPADGKKLDTRDVTLNADINDRDFALAQSDSVDVEIQTKAPTESSFSTHSGTTTLLSNGSVGETFTAGEGGEWEWRVVATDEYGEQTTTGSRTFLVPDQITIRNETDTSEIVDGNINITVRFYGENEIYERRGNPINLTGLPVTQSFIVEIGVSDNYHRRTVLLDDIYQQQNVYLLNKSVSSVENRFVLNDQTGGLFSDNNARLRVEKPLNESGSAQVKWVVIHADEFGVAGVTTRLEKGQRYRLTLLNDQGDTRVLGTYTADVDETRELTASAGRIAIGEPDRDFAYTADFVNTTDSAFIRFSYNDTTEETDEVTFRIYERGNESNVLKPNQTFSGPLGSLSVTEPLTDNQTRKDWVVQAWFTRGGQTHTVKIPVGGQRPLMMEMPWWLKAIISIGTIWIVAGLFSQLNGDIGAIVVAGLGGMFWFVGFLPPGTGLGVVLLAMLTAAVIFIRERKSAGGL